MPLAVQIVLDAHTQADGSRYVKEVYSDGLGVVDFTIYRSRDTDDRDAIAQARLAKLAEAFAERELRDAINEDRAPALRFQTGPQLLARMRDLYRAGRGEEVVRIARWIRRRIQSGDVTENQVRGAFGLTVPEWDALKVKLQAMDDALSVVEASEGE